MLKMKKIITENGSPDQLLSGAGQEQETAGLAPGREILFTHSCRGELQRCDDGPVRMFGHGRLLRASGSG
jgi:hypothetical protein